MHTDARNTRLLPPRAYQIELFELARRSNVRCVKAARRTRCRGWSVQSAELDAPRLGPLPLHSVPGTCQTASKSVTEYAVYAQIISYLDTGKS